MRTPTTRYAKNGEVRIAYQVVGHGPIDLVFVPGFISNLDVHWEDPGFAHLMQRLGSFTRLILFDKRGTGLSDRVDAHHLPGLETRMDDVRAVMDAAGSGRAVLLGASEGGPMSILFAATHPERTRALILYGSYAHFHTWVLAPAGLEEFIAGIERDWGTGASAVRFAPDQAKDERFRDWWARYERQSCSPSAAIALARMNAGIDERSVLPAVRVPTLVIHRRDDARVKHAGGVYLAQHIAGAKFVTLAGRDHPIWTGDVDSVIDEIEEFVTGARPEPHYDRVLATLMLARPSAPSRQAARLGDRAWAERLGRLQEIASDVIARHRGERLASASDEIAARFDGPARAVRCAAALCEAGALEGIPLAAGIHTGEIAFANGAATGIALHLVQRIAAAARSGEVLVSAVVADLVAGSGLHFAERTSLAMPGIDNSVRVLALAPEQHLEPAARIPSSPDVAALSTREREVIALIADGLSNATIAERLRLSEHTVKRHVANILMKLDLPSRAAAAAFVARERPG